MPTTSSRSAATRTRRRSARRRADGVIRYAVVGLGHIAQVAVLPAFKHARRNSRLVAVVSDDPAKRRAAAKRYGLTRTFSYEEYDECLAEVDAVYIALPNSMHEEYTVRAARAGVHVLCEKPLADTAKACERMVRACHTHRVQLMVAYRLHFEALNTEVMDLIRQGRVGEPRYFNSSFSQMVRPGDIRTDKELGGGTLFDIGTYCINAARYLFRDEPTEVMALSANTGRPRLKEIDATTGALLRFGDDRVAAFVTSFDAQHVSAYRMVGTKGQVAVEPAYGYSGELAYELTAEGRTTRKRIGKRDQFAPELLYFSDCILHGTQPEPSGEDGTQDVRIIEALYRSARTRRAVRLPKHREKKRPSGRQRITRPGVKKPRVVHAKGPRQGS
ncbi:MAG: Gfo/Idh/MocA family protein [Vicinamibacterales bacterium]